MKLLKDLLGITRRQRLRRLELQVNHLSENAVWAAKKAMRLTENSKITADLIQGGARNRRDVDRLLLWETMRNNKQYGLDKLNSNSFYSSPH